LAILPAGTEL